MIFQPIISRASVAEFYPNLSPFQSDPHAYAEHVLSRYETDRQALCDALAKINMSAKAGSETLANIDVLRDTNTVAVVTGQQAGLFGGPLYTIYKALSAIRLAERLNAEGIKAVPVFWIATEDHDMDEVASIGLVDRSEAGTTVHYRPTDYVSDAPVGCATLDSGIRAAIDEVFERLPQFPSRRRDNRPRGIHYLQNRPAISPIDHGGTIPDFAPRAEITMAVESTPAA